MQNIKPDTFFYNVEIYSAPDVVERHDRVAAFAARAAQVEFGRFYAPAEHAGFVDQSPAQIAIRRAGRWRKAA